MATNAADTIFPRADKPTPRNDRSCQNLPCLGGFLVVVAAMGGFTYWSVSQEDANVDRLTHAMDFNGQICGKDAGVEDKPYLYVCGASEAGKTKVSTGEYPNRLDFKSKTCVSECPGVNGSLIDCISRPLVFPREKDCATEGCVQQLANGVNVQIRKSVTWEISQSISQQYSYPTEPYRGELCVPFWDAPNGLRDQLISGPHSSTSSLAQAFGSVMNAWPVLLIVFGVATLLSVIFLFLMSRYAGLVLLISLGLEAFLIGFIGAFLAVGIFFSPFDETGSYYQWNPIYRSVYGESARVLTFFLGLLNIGLCILMCRAAKHSIARIDEAIGIIHASFEFIFPEAMIPFGKPETAPYSQWFQSSLLFLILVPFVSAVVVCAVVGGLMYAYMLVMSAGAVESRGVWINSQAFPSLSKQVTKPLDGVLWDLCVLIYGAGMIWTAELMIGMIQYVTTFCVCEWFFFPIKDVPNDDKSSQPFIAAYGKYGQKVENVRVHGVDAVLGGRRTGYIENDTQRGRGKVLVVPIGQRGPDGRDFLHERATIEVKAHEFGWVGSGLYALFRSHVGSLLWLSWPVFLSRPFRMLSEVIKFLLTPPSDVVIRNAYIEDDPKTLYDIIVALGGLFTGFINHRFGGFSRDTYVDLVLRGSNASGAAGHVQEFILKAGGVIAFMHGMTRIYEIVGVFFLSAVSTLVGFCMMTSMDMFREPTGSNYIEDPAAMTFLCLLISVLVAFNWMSLFSNTADTLLYCFLWTRKELAKRDTVIPPLDHEQCRERNRDKYCPNALLSILASETAEAPAEAFKADSKSNLTRFNHAHKKFLDSTVAYATGKQTNLFGDGERESLLKSTRGPTSSR